MPVCSKGFMRWPPTLLALAETTISYLSVYFAGAVAFIGARLFEDAPGFIAPKVNAGARGRALGQGYATTIRAC